MPRGMKFPQELRERAVRMVAEIGEPGAVRRVAEKLGASPDAVRSEPVKPNETVVAGI